MTALVLSLLAKFGPYIVGAIALAFGAMKLRQSGANAERAKQAAKEAVARSVADDVENDVGMLRDKEVREALEKWSRR